MVGRREIRKERKAEARGKEFGTLLACFAVLDNERETVHSGESWKKSIVRHEMCAQEPAEEQVKYMVGAWQTRQL